MADSNERPRRNPRDNDAAGALSGSDVRVFTLGYEGRSPSEVLEIVRARGIEAVLDVRENASSRKEGFDSGALEKEFARIGVRYVHLPQLGCDRASRHALWRGGATEAFLDAYRRRLADRPRSFEDLINRIRSGRTLLLCLERDASRCHRAVLAERLRKIGVTVEDLKGG